MYGARSLLSQSQLEGLGADPASPSSASSTSRSGSLQSALVQDFRLRAALGGEYLKPLHGPVSSMLRANRSARAGCSSRYSTLFMGSPFGRDNLKQIAPFR